MERFVAVKSTGLPWVHPSFFDKGSADTRFRSTYPAAAGKIP
jgi:hypothetical protein